MKNKKLKLHFRKEVLAFPYQAVMVLFVIIPLILILVYAFTDANGSFTTENFQALSNKVVWTTLGRSFFIAFMTTIICLLLAYPTALALTKVKANRRLLILMAFVMPIWINSLLRIYAVRLFYSDLLGMERGWLLTIIGSVYDYFPFMLLPIYTILQDMDKGLIEASNDLGASPVRTFVKIRLPLSIPGIVSGILMVFMPMVSSFAIFDVLGYNGGSADSVLDGRLFGNLVYYYFEKGHYNDGSVFALILLVLIIISTVISNIISKYTGERKGGTIA